MAAPWPSPRLTDNDYQRVPGGSGSGFGERRIAGEDDLEEAVHGIQHCRLEAQLVGTKPANPGHEKVVPRRTLVLGERVDQSIAHARESSVRVGCTAISVARLAEDGKPGCDRRQKRVGDAVLAAGQ